VQAGRPGSGPRLQAGTAILHRLRDAIRHRAPSARTLPAGAPVPSLAGIVAWQPGPTGSARAPGAVRPLRRFAGILRHLSRAALWDSCRLAVFCARDPLQLIRQQRRLMPHYTGALRFAWRALRQGRAVRVVERGAAGEAGALLEVDDPRKLAAHAAEASVLTFAGRYRAQAAVFKVATDAPGRAALRRERTGLNIARRACLPAGLDTQLAACLGFTEQPPVLVQQRLAGRSTRLRHRGHILPEAELRAHVTAAMVPLLRLHAQARRVPDGPDHALIFSDLPAFLDQHPALAAPLAPALRALQNWPARRDMGAVLVHGDYWLGNLLFGEGGEVCGIVDWERCRDGGCPGLDALHLAAATYGVWRARPLALVFEEIWTRRWSSAFLHDHVEAAKAAIGLSDEDVSRLALLLWLCYVRISVLNIGRPAEDWLLLNVERPARSVPAWDA